MKTTYSNKNILITGGLGFIGSNLAIKLVEQKAKITIVDAMIPRQGANLFNIEPIKNKVIVKKYDIREPKLINDIVKDKDYIFHLAGQVSHVDSIRDPLKDLSINVEGTLVVLEACRRLNPKARLIFTGTRGQYGSSIRLPVNESHPMNPKGVYAISNLCAEQLVRAYNDIHKIKSITFRITNTYGPRHQMRHDEYGVLNFFIRKAIDDEKIPVFGDGRILRDFLYVDDLTNALIVSGLTEDAYGDVFNVGSGKAINFIELAKSISRIAASGSPKFTEYTTERKQIEPGDYYTDISKIKRIIGWEPKIDLEDGIKRTIDYYRKNKQYYWE
ncbi:MAG: GDP-mannose 4,6-dehydratase [Candidatus Omnitrophica bacterium]|nr:GDP-mannose 4,6-dehydratase [Candidatus Omnitrophota bacterium]